MSATYWKAAGENIARGLGEKTIRRLGLGGKFIGRAGAVVGIGFLAYELFKHYKENIEAEPAYQEMRILQTELEKWTSAISCLGREPFEDKAFGSLEEGGAINALYPKQSMAGSQLKAADPEVARRIMELNQLKTDMIEDPDPIEKMEKMQLLYTEGESMQVPSTRLRGRPAFEKAVPIRQRR